MILADDHGLIRAGLRAILERHCDVSVVGEAEDGRAAVSLASELRPDLVIMDISMPGLNGIEATRQLTSPPHSLRVIGLSMHADPQYIRGMLNAGAMGYLLKNCSPDELSFAVKSVLAGRTYLTPTAAGVVVSNYVRGGDASQLAAARDADRDVYTVLTAREREVLQLLAEGNTSKEIAAALHIGTKTVETHRASAMHKLKLRTTADLVRYAVRNGIVQA